VPCIAHFECIRDRKDSAAGSYRQNDNYIDRMRLFSNPKHAATKGNQAEVMECELCVCVVEAERPLGTGLTLG